MTKTTKPAKTALPKAPKGVTVIGLGNSRALHNAIAKAVGEPKAPRRNARAEALKRADLSVTLTPTPEPMLAPHAEAEIDRIEAGLIAENADAPVTPIGDVVDALLNAPAGTVVDIVSGEVHSAPPPVSVARKPAKKATTGKPAPAAPAAKPAKKAAPKSDALTDEQIRLLRALRNARVFEGKPVHERVGVWVRSAVVHDSLMPHGLPPRQVPGVMGGLKKRGLIECGWDKAATVRLTQAGIEAKVGEVA